MSVYWKIPTFQEASACIGVYTDPGAVHRVASSNVGSFYTTDKAGSLTKLYQLRSS